MHVYYNAPTYIPCCSVRSEGYTQSLVSTFPAIYGMLLPRNNKYNTMNMVHIVGICLIIVYSQ
jgi:hypothetical protein